MKRTSVAIAAGFASLLTVLGTMASAQSYTITDLGRLSPGALNTWAQVVGTYNGHAYIWTRFGGMRDLGTLAGGSSSSAAAINDFGVVTGTADGAGTVISLVPPLPNQACSDLTQPFVRIPGKQIRGLGTVGINSQLVDFWCLLPFYGSGVNDLNQIIGYTAAFEDNYQWGFLWTKSDGMTVLGSSFPPTFLNGISNTGQIVGETGVLIDQATYWKNGVATGLEALDGSVDSGYSSSANGINDLAQIVGWSTTTSANCYLDSSCPMHAVQWMSTGQILDLGTLPGDTVSTASNINIFGQIIGSTGNTVERQASGLLSVVGRPFIWTEHGGMRDLNTLIPATSGWVLNSVTGINLWGQIVGSGTRNGQAHGFLLTPSVLNIPTGSAAKRLFHHPNTSPE